MSEGARPAESAALAGVGALGFLEPPGKQDPISYPARGGGLLDRIVLGGLPNYTMSDDYMSVKSSLRLRMALMRSCFTILKYGCSLID